MKSHLHIEKYFVVPPPLGGGEDSSTQPTLCHNLLDDVRNNLFNNEEMIEGNWTTPLDSFFKF